jgi:hypothetical protein
MLLSLLFACPVPDDESKDGTDTGDSGGTSEVVDAVCTEATPVPCEDEIISDFSLHDDKTSRGDIENTEAGGDWLSIVDATAGGSSSASKNAWIYARFTEAGLEKVDIDDETALEDMTWHIAARRYIIRLNSGASGPSCVGAAKVRDEFSAVTASSAADLNYQLEDFYTEDCELKEDNSGMPGSPATQLSTFWEYVGSCVGTTGQVWVLQLDSGDLVKFTVDAYYADGGQDECNSTGATSEESAIYTWRWAML